MSSTGFVWLEQFAWHNTGNYTASQPFPHPESPETKSRFASLVAVSGLGAQLASLEVNPATREDLLRVHTSEHVDRIEAESLRSYGGDAGDGESPFGQGSFEIARLGTGSTIAAVDSVLTGAVRNAYVLCRPPGHHARTDRGMGYCIFANIAVAIQWAREHHSVSRVAVVDWDVHHGNGTQQIFFSDPETLTISLHQDGLFPLNSGSLEENGDGEGVGANINIPLPAGSGNGAYVDAMEVVVAPALRRFEPELVIVASGLDASAADPLGRMMVTSDGYRELTRLVMALADELCDGRLVMSHEGGYSPTYVPYCGLAILEEMSGIRTDVVDHAAAYFAQMPGAETTAAQSGVIAAAAALVERVPTRTRAEA